MFIVCETNIKLESSLATRAGHEVATMCSLCAHTLAKSTRQSLHAARINNNPTSRSGLILMALLKRLFPESSVAVDLLKGSCRSVEEL